MNKTLKAALFGIGCSFAGASIALAAVAANGVKDAREIAANNNAAIGFGLEGTEAYDSSAVVRRTGNRAGKGQGDKPALLVQNTRNCGSGACTALETKGGGIGLLVHETRGNKRGIVVDMGNLNTNGSKRDRVGLEVNGNIEICGKSKTKDAKCSNEILLYVKDGGSSGKPAKLLARFKDGTEVVVAQDD